jgi:hypothetical protein
MATEKGVIFSNNIFKKVLKENFTFFEKSKIYFDFPFLDIFFVQISKKEIQVGKKKNL